MRPDASENSQISSSTIVRAARAAGSHPHLASVLQQGWKSANIRRLKIVPNVFGEKPVLKLMFAALIRAAESWRGLRFTEFELRQLDALRKDLDAGSSDEDRRQAARILPVSLKRGRVGDPTRLRSPAHTGRLRLVSSDDTPLILDPKFFVRELSDVHRDRVRLQERTFVVLSVCALLSRRTTPSRSSLSASRKQSTRQNTKTALQKTAR